SPSLYIGEFASNSSKVPSTGHGPDSSGSLEVWVRPGVNDQAVVALNCGNPRRGPARKVPDRLLITFGRWRASESSKDLAMVEGVNAPIVFEVTVRADGKRYPVGGTLPERERWRAAHLAHRYHCRDGLSVRQTQVALAKAGIRRSLGILHRDL